MEVVDMSSELLDCVMEYFKQDNGDYTEDDREAIASILHYLYHNTTNSNLQNQIRNIMSEDLKYCVDCGSKLKLYTWQEVHTEVPPPNIETFSDYFCPECDIGTINDFRYEEELY